MKIEKINNIYNYMIEEIDYLKRLTYVIEIKH